MGGRGMEFRPQGRGVQPSRSNFGINLANAVPGTLREALGARGASMGLAEAASGANPYYNPSYDAYTANCQRCVVAYELRRRGYDVVAQPTYLGDTLPQVAHRDQSGGGANNGRWMGAFQNARVVDVGSRNPSVAKARSEVQENINSQMRKWGDGSRAVVQTFWSQGGGHVFNVENRHGRIVWVDAQPGKYVSQKRYTGNMRPDSVGLVRTDNLRVSDRARNFVMQEGTV